MNYIKIHQDGSFDYPYSLSRLKEENPNTSFPDDLTLDLLSEYNIFMVYRTQHGDDYTKNYTEGEPKLENGIYYQVWIVSDASEVEIQQRIDNKWVEIKSIRNQYLAEYDWTQLPDSPLTTEKKQEWATYRQELRDITLQPDPFNIIWPIKPL